MENKDIYIAGPYCAGKSWASVQLSQNLKLPQFETDDVIIPLIKKYKSPIQYPEFSTIEVKRDTIDGFKSMLNGQPRMIMNGFALNYRDVRETIRGINGRDYLLFNIVPGYERWKRLFDLRAIALPEKTAKEHKSWEMYSKWLQRFEAPDEFYYTVEDSRMLSCSVGVYQRPELSLLKFNGLSLENVHGRVLDLGCAEGYMGQFLLEKGQVTKVTGIDSSWWFLEKARARGYEVVLGDLNSIALNDLGMFDYTLCLSVLHRVMDKEHLIRQIAACTRYEAIFELPLNCRSGLVMERYDSVPGHTKAETQAWCPSQEILELWFKQYFASFELVGLSPLKYGDSSRRVVYKCLTLH